MPGIEDGIATVVKYADNDYYGYTLMSGNHYSYDPGTDCAGLARMYAAAVEGVGFNNYPDFGTWNERQVLTARGWKAIPFSRSKMKRGDILLRALGDSSGHTVIYLGNGLIVGAEGNWDGRRGDSSGREICVRSYYDYSYNYILRPPTKPEVHKVNIKEVDHGIYRMYNPNDGQHHLTASHSEAETLASVGWDYEGVAFRSGSGDKVYRLYNPFGGQHILTASAEEGMGLAIAGWVVEAVAFRAGGDKDVYRVYNPNNGDHLFTTSTVERDSLVRAGWQSEGVAFKAK